MILLNYNIPDNSYIPQEIYEYTNNERMLLILFGNVTIQTLKSNFSLKNEGNEKIVKEITDKYNNFLKEKDTKITQLEITNNSTIELYKDLIEIEKDKLLNEIQKEVLKEKQFMEEKIQIIKEKYEKIVISLKSEKEFIIHQLEISKEIEKEKALLEEKLKNNDIVFKHIIDAEKNNIYKEVFNNFQKEKEFLKDEIVSLKAEIQNIMNQQEKEKYKILTENYNQKENAIIDLQKSIEEIKIQTLKSSLSQDKGKEGETYFFELASNVFEDIDGFEIEDKTKTGHMGDFF